MGKEAAETSGDNINLEDKDLESDYTLTLHIDGKGTITPEEGTHHYVRDEVVDLKANPHDAWKFSHWDGRVGNENNAETTIKIEWFRRVDAVFTRKKSKIINVNNIEGKSVAFGTSFAGIYLPKTVEVSLETQEEEPATDTAKMEIDWLSGDYDGKSPGTYSLNGVLLPQDSNIENPNDLKATIDVTVNEEGADKEYEVAVECDEEEGWVEGHGKFKTGEKVELSAFEEKEYRFSGWAGKIPYTATAPDFEVRKYQKQDQPLKIDLIEALHDFVESETISFYMPAQDVNIEAVFEERPTYGIRFDMAGDGVIKVDDVAIEDLPETQVFPARDDISLEADPQPKGKYKFDRWGGNSLDIGLGEFAEPAQEMDGNYWWRGYAFRVSRQSILNDIYGGATAKNEFRWAVYKVQYNEFEGYHSLKVIDILENDQGDELWGDVPGERHSSFQEFADNDENARDIDINITLDPDEYYVIAQGRLTSPHDSDEVHYELDPGTFDYSTFIEENDILEFFGPDETPEGTQLHQYCFRWNGDELNYRNQYVPINSYLDPGTNTFPHMSLVVEAPDIKIENIYDVKTEMSVMNDGYVTAYLTDAEYTLEVNIEGTDNASVTIDPEKDSYTYGDTVTLKAEFDEEECRLVEWTGDIDDDTDSTADEITVTMDRDRVITATFTEERFTLYVNTEGEGSVDIEPYEFEYLYGDEVTLTADPDEHWQFDKWTGDAEGDSLDVTIEITENKEVTAVFTEILISITVEAIPMQDGSGTVDIYVEDEYETSVDTEGESMTIFEMPSGNELKLEAEPGVDSIVKKWEGIDDEAGD